VPTATFFRLPEEKRRRLLDACWSELTGVRFTDVSINRIITEAHIPRGSFYQYFSDKEDLIHYLLDNMREYFISLLQGILVEARGDLFAMPLMAYDRFFSQRGDTDPMLALFIKLVTLNKGLDLQNFIGSPQGFIGEQEHFLPDPLWEVVDPSKLRRGDRGYADNIFRLSCAVLALAIMETPRSHGQMEQTRASIEARMDLLRYGGAAEGYGYKEETI